jgi:signal peptidase II
MAARARILGFGLAAAAVAVDQAHKAYMLGPFDIEMRGRVAVNAYLDLVMVWNRGVSYGLLSQEGDAGRWFLIGIGLFGAVLFSVWLWTANRVLTALSLGLIIGGAFSNVIDRLAYGAVADFFLFHIGSFEWYVFNLADVWIVAGVAGALLAWATERRVNATEA